MFKDIMIFLFLVLCPAVVVVAGLYIFIKELDFGALFQVALFLGAMLFGLMSLFPEKVAKPVQAFWRKYSKIIFKKIHPFLNWGLAAIGGVLLFYTLSAFLPLLYAATLEPFIIWLQDGVWPPRDLYWAFSNTDCVAENWDDMGRTALDYCRLNYVVWTDWIGLNHVVNWFMGLHVLVASAMAIVAFVFLSAMETKVPA